MAGVLAHILLILHFEENKTTDTTNYLGLQTFLAKTKGLRFFCYCSGELIHLTMCRLYLSYINCVLIFFSSCMLLFCM